jgi:hypothetical protein
LNLIKNEIDSESNNGKGGSESLKIRRFVDYCIKEIENVKIKFLCGNEATRDEMRQESGESQGRHMLDFLFNIYRNSVILIEPATPSLIPYYTKYNKPSCPYDPNTLKETYGFLVFGNLSYLSEICFPTIFRSINMIKNMIKPIIGN